MNKNEELFDKIFFLLKRERKIKNTTHAVELLSTFVYLKFLQINLLEKGEGFGFYFRDKAEFKSLCHHIIYNSDIDKNACNSNYNVKDFLANVVDNFILNVNNEHLIYCLSYFFIGVKSIPELREFRWRYNKHIEKMVLESSQSGEFYTPKVIAEVLVSYLKPNVHDKVYDPACGTSGFLVEVAKFLEAGDNFSSRPYMLNGSDISFFAFIVSKANLILNSNVESDITIGDSLVALDSIYKDNYDIILTNPPFGKSNSREFQGNDKEHFIDYRFLRLVMSALKLDGRAAVILPERFFFDSSSQSQHLKEELFNRFCVDCVLSLPSGVMLPYTGIKLVVIFFSKRTPSSKVWFYKLTKKEKLTKSKKLKFSDFDDFFEKEQCKLESENSWNIDIDELDLNFNVFDKAENQITYSDFSSFSSSLVELSKVGNEIRNTIHSINERVHNIQSNVAETIDTYKFPKVKLGQLVTSLKTVSLSKEKLLDKGKYPVYGGNGIIGYYDEYIHSGEFILVGRVGALCGNVHYVKGCISVTNNSMILKCIETERVHPPYLARLLSNLNLRGLASGTAQPHLTVSKIKNIEIKLPPITEQIKIEDLLSMLDQELEQHDLLIEQLSNKSEYLKNSLNLHLLQI
ncbi:N-6 DNA methylase [Pseudoalteromonas luteoviolacea]|uniref:N-6 DNA methylase n=1 Tax=Pseudoalteromonas luteoviolacea TaxID=43657 RepID=UPI001EED4C44|nr:N-6 DNA methylase [Pseudoalteromonas luteoviolacea]MCF6439872.1 N-6 DNA methylase [Pseudoalteromonas luteoviolacea]